MIPYKDTIPTERFPIITVAFIAINVAVFALEVSVGLERAVYAFGAIPANLLPGYQVQGVEQPIPAFATIGSSMFMHGGLLHLGGNMLYLWIFGNNIEDRLGPLRFIAFYFLGGLVAVYAHVLTEPSATVPMVGASGAVAAILGAYVLLWPHAKVYTVVFIFFIVDIWELPALIVIGFWAIIQLVNGLAGAAGQGSGGVAWFAHIGGFLFGLFSVKIFMLGRRKGKQW